MEADEPASPQEPPSPPPPPSPPSPAAPDTPGPPQPEQPTEAYARQLLLEEWRPPGGSLELPPRLTWKLLFLRRPLYRNLLRSPNPEGAGRGGKGREGAAPRPTDRPLPSLHLLPRAVRSDRLSPHLSVCSLVSVPWAQPVSLHPFLSLLSLCPPPSPWGSLFLPCITLFLFLCHMSLSLPVCVSLSLILSVGLSLPASLRMYFCLFL